MSSARSACIGSRNPDPGKSPIRPKQYREALDATKGHGAYDHLICPTYEDVGDGEEVHVQEELEEEIEQLKEVPNPGQPTKKISGGA